MIRYSKSVPPLICGLLLSGDWAPAGAEASSPELPTVPHLTTKAYRTWRNVRIDGGGFVTGLVASTAPQGPLFARTDVGGAYRWINATESWMPITDAFSGNPQIESIAADPSNPSVVYIASGDEISRSTDLGTTWVSVKIPAAMNGNGNGRCVGERLAVDSNLPSILFFGSRRDGLFRSADSGKTWSKIKGFTDVRGEIGITFVLFDRQSGVAGRGSRVLYLGVDGAKAGLFRSVDGGANWLPVLGQPVGMFPNHAVFNNRNVLFLTYSNGPGPGDMTAGAVWRFNPGVLGPGAWKEISPVKPGKGSGDRFGYGGLAIDPRRPDALVVSSMDRWAWGDCMWRADNASKDVPEWTVLFSSSVKPAWLSPVSYKARDTHWISSIAMPKANPDTLFFSFGQGVQRCDHVSAGPNALWRFSAHGLEETVVMSLISPTEGPPLVSGLGDIGGFAHRDLDVSPASQHSSANTSSLDFAALVPAVLARTGSKPGKYSTDGGVTWVPFACPGPSENGRVAISADGKTFLCSNGAGVAYTRDHGNSWVPVANLPAGSQVVSDRVDPNRFFGFHKKSGAVFFSLDGGATFSPSETKLDGTHFYLHAGIYAVPGAAGEFYVSTQSWQFRSKLFRSVNSGRTLQPVPIGPVRSITAFGFGKALAVADRPAMYFAGTVNMTDEKQLRGIFRSDNEGQDWVRIDDDRHRFGVNVIAGDSRTPGRVYLGTSGRGIVYADP